MSGMTFAQHVDIGQRLQKIVRELERMDLEFARGAGRDAREVRRSISKAYAALNCVRNDAENLLCRTVPPGEHTRNVCAVYYGPLGDGA